MKEELGSAFKTAFFEAGGFHVTSYLNLIRFIAFLCLIMAILWSINHFLGAEEKEVEGFMIRLASRAIRLMIGLTLFICFLTTKG